MGYLTQLLRRLTCRSKPRDTEASSVIGGLPLIQPSAIIRVHVTADGRIQLEDRFVTIEDLERKLTAAFRPDAVVSYSRDNPEEDSDIGAKVIECVCRVGLGIAFPIEAADTINQLYSKGE